MPLGRCPVQGETGVQWEWSFSGKLLVNVRAGDVQASRAFRPGVRQPDPARLRQSPAPAPYSPYPPLIKSLAPSMSTRPDARTGPPPSGPTTGWSSGPCSTTPISLPGSCRSPGGSPSASSLLITDFGETAECSGNPGCGSAILRTTALVPMNADFRGRENNQSSDGCQGQR